MDSYPDLTTEGKCRELLERYPENAFVKYRLALLLRSQGREKETCEVLPIGPTHGLKYDMGLLNYDERIRQRLADWVAYLNRGIWHHWHGSYRKALSDFDKAIMINPTVAYAFCCRANLRATCPDEAFREGQMALEDALTAMKLADMAGELIGDWRHRLFLQVLAAAHAEKNDFQRAIPLQTRALDLAITRTAKSEINQRLEQYRLGSPIRNETGLVRCGF
jgi:tetratricopeptide (TPR) repeat protein